ncbi:MAG: M23 family metallopeptidase [Cellulosilyticaceae bacterium]
MNIEKLRTFLKRYGFYLAVGVISVGAITAVFLMPGTEGDVAQQPNPYATNKEADGKVIDGIDNSSNEYAFDPSILTEENTEENSLEPETNAITESNVTVEVADNNVEAIVTENGEVAANTFNSTTAETPQEPFFVDGDTLVWPVSGDIIVPYKDETTSHWVSESLGQTMRTLGICIAAEDGENVKAAATGTVESIVSDPSTIDTLVNVGNVGEVVVINHGNGYKTLYGMQKGMANQDLIGQIVEVGESIGVVGAPTGPFVSEGTNVYLQLTHNDEVINPEEMLIHRDNNQNASVEMGHAPDQD